MIRGWIKFYTIPYKDEWEQRQSRPIFIKVADISSIAECDEGTEIDMSNGMTITVRATLKEVLMAIREA